MRLFNIFHVFKKKKKNIEKKKTIKDKLNFNLSWYQVVKYCFVLLYTEFLLLFHPVVTTGTRILVMLLFIAIILLPCIKAYKYFMGKIILFTIILILSFKMYIQAPKVNFNDIISIQNDKMITYVGVKYLNGGENKLGIDEEGIIKKSLIDTYMQIFFDTSNIKYFIKSINIWLKELSYNKISDTHTKIKEFTNVKDLNNIKLYTGDFIFYPEMNIIYIVYNNGQNFIVTNNYLQKSKIINNIKINNIKGFVYRWNKKYIK